MDKFQRKGRTATLTIDDLLESKRFEIASEVFPIDKSFMRAILIELIMEAHTVAKNTVIREAMRHQGLDRYELKPLLGKVSDFCSYNIHFSQLDEVSRMYYLEKVSRGNKLSDSEAREILDKIREDLNNE